MIDSIGDTKSDAVNWMQDRYGLLRHVAEQVVADAIQNGKIIISENGVFVEDEDEDEFKNSVKKSTSNAMQKHNRIRFRNHHVKTKYVNKSTDSDNAAVNAASDMIAPVTDEDDEDEIS